MHRHLNNLGMQLKGRENLKVSASMATAGKKPQHFRFLGFNERLYRMYWQVTAAGIKPRTRAIDDSTRRIHRYSLGTELKERENFQLFLFELFLKVQTPVQVPEFALTILS